MLTTKVMMPDIKVKFNELSISDFNALLLKEQIVSREELNSLIPDITYLQTNSLV